MGEDDCGFGLLGHVAAPHQLGLPRGLPAPAHCGERRSHASHGRIVTEVRVRGEGAARERGHFEKRSFLRGCTKPKNLRAKVGKPLSKRILDFSLAKGKSAVE